MEKLISVIVPVYNVKAYLKTCLNSILNQTYNNLEILLIDDGSTDGSEKLCDEFKHLDKRISVYHKKNGGLSDARNYGIDRSNGAFYAFIDSDDALHKDFFLELMKAQVNSDADIVACNITLFHKQSELPELFKLFHNTKQQVYSREDALKEYFSPSGDRIIHHGLCMKIYKKELFQKLRFIKGKLHEDLYITFMLLDASRKVVYIDCSYYFYFQSNTDSICKNYGIKNFLDESEAYEEMYYYFAKQNQVTDELVHFLIIQYLLMLEKGYGIRNVPEIQATSSKIKKWITSNVKRCAYFGIAKKILIQLSLKDIRIYSVLKKVRGK